MKAPVRKSFSWLGLRALYLHPFERTGFQSQQRNAPHNSLLVVLNLFEPAFLRSLGCLWQTRSVSWWRDWFSDLPHWKVSSRQLNLPGKQLWGSPWFSGRFCLHPGGHFIHYELKSVSLISEVWKTSYNEWSAILFVLSASRRREYIYIYIYAFYVSIG